MWETLILERDQAISEQNAHKKTQKKMPRRRHVAETGSTINKLYCVATVLIIAAPPPPNSVKKFLYGKADGITQVEVRTVTRVVK